MNLRQIRESLQAALDSIDTMHAKLELPEESYTLDEAYRKLRALYPEAYISIDMQLNFHASGNRSIEWKVYDGTNGSEGTTLTQAVNKAVIAAKQSQPTDPVAAAQSKLEEVTARPF